jgi:hypothetical protein
VSLHEDVVQKKALGMSKTRGMAEVLVQIDACRQIPNLGATIQTLHNSGFFRYCCPYPVRVLALVEIRIPIE